MGLIVWEGWRTISSPTSYGAIYLRHAPCTAAPPCCAAAPPSTQATRRARHRAAARCRRRRSLAACRPGQG
eukprot:4652069-Prymnesium_polylepis.1